MEIRLGPVIMPETLSERPVVIAGPCSAESEEQVLQTAKELSEIGVKIFRAGIWKPRTKPGGFEGVGSKGLSWLKKVKAETGMLVSTEVANREHVFEALKAGIDILWIGARTSVNPFAVQEIADALKGTDVPVLVKNPVNPDIELWIGAIQRLYNAGLRRIGAIHRGFSSYDRKLYRNLPLWHIPIELKRRIPDICIFCDPSHIGGRRELISPLAQQAMDLNMNGLFVESHVRPEEALSDAAQQLTPDALECIIGHLVIRDTNQTTENLVDLRREIDRIDSSILELFAKRMRISGEIGVYKKEHEMPVLQSSRYDEVLKDRIRTGKALDLSDEFISTVFRDIHQESVRLQLSVMNGEAMNGRTMLL